MVPILKTVNVKLSVEAIWPELPPCKNTVWTTAQLCLLPCETLLWLKVPERRASLGRSNHSPSFRWLHVLCSGSTTQERVQLKEEGSAWRWGCPPGAGGGGCCWVIDGSFLHWEITQRASAVQPEKCFPRKRIIKPSMKRSNPSRQGDKRCY